MIEIVFQNSREALNLHEHLVRNMPSLHEERRILVDEGKNSVVIIKPSMSGEEIQRIRKGFYEFILTHKRDDFFRWILKERFFYTEEEEQDQILSIISSLLEGKRRDLEPFLTGQDEKELIHEEIQEMLTDNISFSFDSFARFRLKPFIEKLYSYVEIGIDEYKMEQEYQVFIETLRAFLSERTPLKDELHVLLMNGETVFYDHDYQELKRSELFHMIDRKLLVNHPVYVDSVTIAPLLSIAPSTIFLYPEHPDQPLVRTIQNIFEERVIIRESLEFMKQRSQAN
ncbi:putative sporulation protein YtxC [Bacillus massilinigeriensis]|uniref:putative sporulation protein YtxC n=1 Tax=Bacillus mediterraneensis TaxID=1805474 RepID=UPI0008F95119|nr:putative sporulation protein YtxC [Bacillus mediterraneensis]